METANKLPCPRCGGPCADVSPRTIRHHIRQAWQWEEKASRYFYCGTPACVAVYFGDDGSVIEQTQLRIPDAKRATPDALACHCFGITVRDAEHHPEIRDFALAQTRERECACEVRNPSGRCCLADLAKVGVTAGNPFFGTGGTAKPAEIVLMTDKLKALMAEINRDHELFDTLIDQSAEHLTAYAPCAEFDADKASPCRTRIHETLAKYLMISLRHFDREYQAMHEIGFPRDFIEAHAVEHDRLLTQVNQTIDKMQNGASIASLIVAVGEIGSAYRHHRDVIDTILLDYLYRLMPLLKQRGAA
ncbi:hypothetical protein MASR1M60_11010 [Rhodocyclaceae bacterium]